MSEFFKDIQSGLNSYFENLLGPAVDVKMAYKNETTENEDSRIYPCAAIGLIASLPDKRNQYQGMVKITSDNPDGITADVSKKPNPVQLHFQVDTYAIKKEDDWAMAEAIISEFAFNKPKIITPDERELRIYPMTFDPNDKLQNNLWRKTFRFYLTLWIPDTADPVTEHLVLEQRFDINEETISEQAQ